MKLLIGQANSGKTASLFARIAEQVSNRQGNPLLLTPSTNAADVLMMRLQPFMPMELPKSARPVPLSFPALSERILKAGGRELNFLSAIQRHRLLRSVIADLSQEKALLYFNKTADKPGLVHSLAKFINELWRSGTDAEDFANLRQSRSIKDQDVAHIFQRYEAALRQIHATDAEGAILYALRLLETISLGERLEGERVLQNLLGTFPLIAADGFDFYTPVQVKMLAQLSKLGIDVMATLTYEADRAVHLWQKRTLERFIEERAEIIKYTSNLRGEIPGAAASLMSDTPATEADNVANKTDEEARSADLTLRGKGEGIGGDSISQGEKYDSDSRGEIAAGIEIISAPDRAVEVRAVAREVKRLVLENSFALDEITVVCRSLDLYTRHFERVFPESSIPLELDHQLALGENAFIIALLRLLGLAENLYTRRAVLECLRSPFFDFSEFELDAEVIDLLEQISLAEKITHSRNQWRDALEHPTLKSAIEGKVEWENSIERSLGSSLASRLNKFFEAITFKPWAQRAKYVREIENLITTLKCSERLNPAENWGWDDNAQQAIAACQVFHDLLNSLGEESANHTATDAFETSNSDQEIISTRASFANQIPAKEISWSAFFAELESAVAATSFSRPKGNSPAVVVQEAHNLRPRNYRAIFVIGLIEGEFPKKSTETTPYTVAEKAALGKAGIDFAETINDAGADLTQFHKTMTRASERLFLSCSRSDFSGGELLKSYLIDEVKAVAKTREIRIAQVENAKATMASSEVVSLAELALLTSGQLRHQLERVDRANQHQCWKHISAMLDLNLRSWKATMRGAVIEHRRLTGKERGSFGGVIVDQKLATAIHSHFNEDYLWSASKINNYGLCPFRFFAGNVLNLSPLEEPSEGFGADRLGSAYHKILEKTYTTLKEQGIELTAKSVEKATAIAVEICEATLQKLLDEREIRKSGMWDFDKSEIKKRVVNLLRFEALSNEEQMATPLAFEQTFGFGNKPPLVIETAEGKIKIRGSIDRIDKNHNGLVIIDYKTSRSPLSAKEALEGRNLQLPIYLMAANRALKHDDPVTSGFYLHISSCRKGSEFPNKHLALEDLAAITEAYICDYVSKARRAEFPVSPNQNRCPPFCEFDVMCRIQSLGSTPDDE